MLVLNCLIDDLHAICSHIYGPSLSGAISSLRLADGIEQSQLEMHIQSIMENGTVSSSNQFCIPYNPCRHSHYNARAIWNQLSIIGLGWFMASFFVDEQEANQRHHSRRKNRPRVGKSVDSILLGSSLSHSRELILGQLIGLKG